MSLSGYHDSGWLLCHKQARISPQIVISHGMPHRLTLWQNTQLLTHLPMCHIFASVNWVDIGSDNGLSPIRHQAIIWSNSEILSVGPLGTNLSEILIKIQKIFIHENASEYVSFVTRQPFCPGGDELTDCGPVKKTWGGELGHYWFWS